MLAMQSPSRSPGPGAHASESLASWQTYGRLRWWCRAVPKAKERCVLRRLLSSRLLHPQARRAGRRLLPRTTAEVWAAAASCAAAAAGAAAAASQSSEKPGTSAVQSLVRFSSTEEHRRLEDDYELGEEIGRGHFATVRPVSYTHLTLPTT